MAHTESCFTYYDRRSGQLVTEPIYASPFFRWSYTTVPGGLATELLFRHRCVTRLCGWYYKQPWSRRRIPSFVLKYNVNMEESARRVEEFTSFNDFFTREIDLATRPIHPDPRVCVAPNDGRILGYPVVDADTTFGIKRHTFDLCQFLRDDTLAKQYVGGSMVIGRFYLQDYHYFHFPDSGTPGPALPIQGKHYALGPYWGRTPVPWFSENYRMLTLFDSDHFGQIAMVEIGAFTVGSIQQLFNTGVRVPKGARKGFFELGGSTVVLLFQRGAIRLDEDLCARTEENIETFVRFGESIGRASSADTGSAGGPRWSGGCVMKDRATVQKKTVPAQTSQIYFLEKPVGFSIPDLNNLSQEKREAIRLLHRRDDKHNMMILVFFAIWAVAGVAALTVDLLAVQVLSCLLIACAIIGCTVLVHEASHNLLFMNPTVNRWFGLLCGLPVLVSVTGFRTNHAFHHARRGSYDESAEGKAPPRGDATSVPKYILSIIAGAYGFITALPVIAIKYAQGATRRKTLTEYALIVGVYALVFSAFPTEAILKLWFFPMILAAHLTEFRAVAEHGLTTRGNVFTATRTVVSNRVVSFLMCNINYHLEHHLFPGMPWYNLPKVHRLLQDEYRQAGSSVYPSYTRFCIDFFKVIWRGLLPNARLIPVEARQH